MVGTETGRLTRTWPSHLRPTRKKSTSPVKEHERSYPPRGWRDWGVEGVFDHTLYSPGADEAFPRISTPQRGGDPDAVNLIGP